MLRRFRRFVLAVPAAGLLACTPSLASAAIEISPMVGWYAPLNSIQKNTDVGLYVLEAQPAPAFGARLTWLSTSRFGIEASAMGAFGNHQLLTISAASRTIFADARVRVRLTGADSPTVVFFTGGVGIVKMKDSLVGLVPEAAFSFKSVTSGVAGFGLGLPVNEHWSLRLDIEDHFYQADVQADETFIFRDGGQSQNDVVGSLGIVVPIGRR